MSTTQELIERLKRMAFLSDEAASSSQAAHGNWIGMTEKHKADAHTSTEAADRLASLESDNAALKAKLVGVDESGLEVAWRQYVTSQAREAGDYRTFTEEQWARVRQGNPPAYSRLRAALAAYLAAVGGGE